MDLDSLKLKTSTQLKDDEKQFLRENVDKLNDEDKEAYSSFLSIEEEPAPVEEVVTEEKPPVEVTPEEKKVEQPAPAPYQFKSEEEAKAFVAKALKEQEEEKQKAIDAARTPEEKKWVEDNWKPQNWNEALKTAVKIAKDEIKSEQKAEQERMRKNAERMEADWQELRKEYKLEDLTTKKGREVHDQIVQVGLDYGKKNFKEAYDMWSKLPKEYGGGYDPVQVVQEVQKEEQKKTTQSMRQAATKLTGKNVPATPAKGSSVLNPISYEDLKKPRQKLVKI